MDGNHLSKRLQQLADWVPEGSHLADIGSDHAYLPIYLAHQHRLVKAIAGEVAEGPLMHTRAAIEAEQLEDLIEPRLGDGLDVLNGADQIDVITIAGMGGQLIVDILTRGDQNNKLMNHPMLLLQPNREAHRVRRWLSDHQYEIIAENLVEENHKRYAMMRAIFNPNASPLTETEIQFGRLTEQANPVLFRQLWEHERNKALMILENLKQSDNKSAKAEFTQRVAQIIARLKEE